MTLVYIIIAYCYGILVAAGYVVLLHKSNGNSYRTSHPYNWSIIAWAEMIIAGWFLMPLAAVCLLGIKIGKWIVAPFLKGKKK